MFAGTQKIVTYVVFSFLLVSTLFAAEPLSLSIEDSVDLSLENNTAVQQEKIAESIARARNNSSWNAFLPDISLSASLRNIHSFAGSNEHTGTNLSAAAGLRLTLQPSVGETMRQTAAEYKIIAIQEKEVKATVMRTVKKSYYAIVTERQRLALYEKNLALAQREAVLARKNYETGLTSELSVLQAQYSAASLEPELMKAKQEFRQTLRAFNILIGLSPEVEIEFVDSLDNNFPKVCVPKNVADRIDVRFDVLSARMALEIAQSRRRAGMLNRYAPTVSLSETATIPDLQSDVGLPELATFTLSVSIPLNGYIPGSSTRITAKELDAAVERATLTLKETKTQALEQIIVLIDTLDRLQRSIELTRMNESVAVRAYDLSREGYNSGLVTQTDLDSTRQKSLEAGFAVLNAQYLYKVALIELAYALAIQERTLWIPGEI